MIFTLPTNSGPVRNVGLGTAEPTDPI